MMPYYGMPVGTELEEVGFGFNRGVITGLLRERARLRRHRLHRLGPDHRRSIMGQPMPARAWGVEHLSELDRIVRIIDAGVRPVRRRVPARARRRARHARAGSARTRIDASVRRLLREKFVLGLFDQPYVDVDHAIATIGRADFVAAGELRSAPRIVRLAAPDTGPPHCL